MSRIVACLFLCVFVQAGNTGDKKKVYIHAGDLKYGQKGILVGGDDNKPAKFYVAEVIDAQNMLVRFRWLGMPRHFLVKGLDTKGRVDGERVDIDFPIHASDTKKVGTTTYLVIEPQ